MKDQGHPTVYETTITCTCGTFPRCLFLQTRLALPISTLTP
ncbi:MAG: hypothetical protein NTV80_11200 [Verrucomicrobia bacterium]|nr:hypothetical protein [Verrucomicrobiota bacterium]